jgi:hypothetical protein
VERYEKKSSHSKQPAKVTPQQSWTNLIAKAAAASSSANKDTTLPRHLQPYLQTMANLDNVPRKAKAFSNFTSNSFNLRGPKGQAIVTEIWNYLDSLRNASTPSEIVSESSTSRITTTATTGPVATPAAAENSALSHTTLGASATADCSATTAAAVAAAATTKKKTTKTSSSTLPTKPATTTSDSTVPVKARPTDTARSVDLSKKAVRRAMKHCLKGQAKLKLSRLRTKVRQRVGVDVKDHAQRSLLNYLVKTALASKKASFVQEGKTVSLACRSK